MYCHKSAYIALRQNSPQGAYSWLVNSSRIVALVELRGEDWILLFYRSISRQFQSQGEKSHTATRFGTAEQAYDLGLFFQSNKPFVGEARQSGNNPVAADVALSSK